MKKESIIHTIHSSETEAFTYHVNEVLKNDSDVRARLPLTTDKILAEIEDGIILCKLINASVPGKIPPISPEAINLSPANAYQKIENLNLAISSAQSMGCSVINVRPEFIMEKREHIVMGLIWQIIRMHFSNQITLKRHPQIILLKKEDETDEQMRKIGYEEILIRWLNYHIKKGGGAFAVKNIGNDLANSEAYGHIFANQNLLDLNFWAKENDERAAKIIQTCHKNKILSKVKPEDIVNGNSRLNTILCVQIFNEKHGLDDMFKVIDLPPEPQTDESKQIRIFKNWINSQGIEEVYVNYLMTDLRDGRVLLKVIEKLRPTSVDWSKKYSNKLNSRIHSVQNCNYALEICKSVGVKLVSIDGVDIVDGKVSLTLGLLWQLCRIYWEERVGKINDEQLVEWANSKVPSQFLISNLKDPLIGKCKFLLHIIQAIKPKTVNFDKLKEGSSEEDQVSNINYTIACARKLGAEVMTLWEHIRDVNPRYVGIFLAELQYIEKLRNKMK